MEKLLDFLKTIPEYQLLTKSASKGSCTAVTGVGQINRSHLLAALYSDIAKPMVVICQDDMTAKRLQEDLKAFCGLTAPILPSRDLTLYDSAAVSRGWEQKRLQQLHALSTGKCGLQIMTWEALSLRTMPPKTLLQTSFFLKVR